MPSIHWLNAVDGDFNTPADWGGGSIPGPSDAAILDAAGADFTVTANFSETVRSLQLAANASLDITSGTFTASAGTGVGANAGTISIGPGATLAVAGTLTNTGTIALHEATQHGAIHVASLDIDTAGVTLVGGGTVVLSEAAYRGAQIYGGAGATLVNLDNTISGSGVVGLGGLTVINGAHGVIDANHGGSGLDVAGLTLTNAGLLEATSGGQLFVYNYNTGMIDNRGGVIEAGAGSYVRITSEDIVGGTLISSGSGRLFARSVVFDGTASPVDISGTLTTAGSVTLRGSIVNSGVIDYGHIGFSAAGIDANTTLSGGGTIGGVAAYAAGVTLFNVDNAIGGPLYGGMNVVNEAQGVINPVYSGSGIDLKGQTLTNAGLVEATGTGRNSGMVIQQTTIDNGASGVLLVAHGASMLMRGVDVLGGTLETGATGIVFTRYANVLDGVANAVTIEGVVAINDGVSLTLQGAIINQGSITLRAKTLATDLIVGAPGVSLSGHGALTLSDSGVNLIEGVTASATLTNVNDTISGAGLLGSGQMTLANRVGGVIEATGSNTLSVDTGTNAVINAGTIETVGLGGLTIDSLVRNSGVLAVAIGTLLVNGVVSGKGAAAISGGTLDFTKFFNQAVAFTGSEGVLELARSQIYHGAISGFSKTGDTSLDLRDIGFANPDEATFSGTASGGVLTVTDGTHTANITLKGDYLGATFVASSDGANGTDVVAETSKTATASPHAFISAMAGFGSSAATHIQFPEGCVAREPALIAPRVQIA